MSTKKKSEEIAALANLRVKDKTAICKCGLLESVSEIFPLPFTRPIVFNRETNELSARGYAVKLMEMTKSGGISSKNRLTFFFDYCPFCGTKLVLDKKENTP